MTVDFKNIDLETLVDDSISLKNRTNLFLDLRRLFTDRLCSELKAHDIEISKSKISDSTNLLGHAYHQLTPIKAPNGKLLDINFCASYGHKFYSLEAINYQYGLFTQYYSLQAFKRNKHFSLGNIIIPLKTKNFDFDVKESKQIKIVGFSSDTRMNKRKPFIAFIGIHFDYNIMQSIIEKYLSENDEPILDEVRFSTMSYPIMFTCRKTGELYTCTCFENYIDWNDDFYRFAPRLANNKYIKEKIIKIKYLDGICHLCTNTTPLLNYGNSMYYSSFLVKFLPYYSLMNKKRTGSIFSFDDSENKLTENKLRAKFGYYKIGERWLTETLLFNLLKEIFVNTEVIFHYHGEELEGLELDIWIPKYKLGVEYQGIQHFKAIKHWGGEKNLEKQKLNDQRKRNICNDLGYNLIEFFYNEDITKDLILRKLNEEGITGHNNGS